MIYFTRNLDQLGELKHTDRFSPVCIPLLDWKYSVGQQIGVEAQRTWSEQLYLQLGDWFSNQQAPDNENQQTQVISDSVPQGCCLSPLLYILFTHDWVARHEGNSVIRFMDDTIVTGLISNTGLYGARTPPSPRTLIRPRSSSGRQHPTLLYIHDPSIETVSNFKFLCVQI